MALALALSLASGLGLSACESAGQAKAEAACKLVSQSISLYRRASSAASQAQAAAQQADALSLLRRAQPLAGLAATKSTRWQALATTLSEIPRVPESSLITSLSQQCASVGSSEPPPPVGPATGP